MVVFLCNSSNPLERPFWFFLTLSYPLSSFYLSWVCGFRQGPYSKRLSVCHFILFFLLSSISTLFFFFFIIPFWDIILVSFLWLDHLCCPFPFFVSFVPSNQFPAIPFSNPPCFHFRSFRSSILPLCTLLFSGLAFPSFLFVLVFVWFSSHCCCHLFFITGSCIFCFSFCCFWLCKCGEGCFGFSPRLFFQNHSRFVILAYFCFFFCLPLQHSKVSFMNPTFELTLPLCFSGVLFFAPLHSSFLLRSFQPVSSHPLLQSTLLSFLVVSLFYSSSLDAIFSGGLALPSCFFLVGFCLVCFWLLLSPFFPHWDFSS